MHWKYAAAKSRLLGQAPAVVVELGPGPGANLRYLPARQPRARTMGFRFEDTPTKAEQRNLAFQAPPRQSSCYLLVEVGIPLALMLDDTTTARRYLATLLDLSARHHFLILEACGRCFEGALRVKTGQLASGVPALRGAVDELSKTGFAAHRPMLLGMLAEGLGQSGNFGEALDVINTAIEESERNEARYCLAELLRLKGDLLLRETDPPLSAAQVCFTQALDLARRQGALSWELRCARPLSEGESELSSSHA
jgi:hypothetical protein